MTQSHENTKSTDEKTLAPQEAAPADINADLEKEYGGRKDGLEPTRFGDWELKGKCVDF